MKGYTCHFVCQVRAILIYFFKKFENHEKSITLLGFVPFGTITVRENLHLVQFFSAFHFRSSIL